MNIKFDYNSPVIITYLVVSLIACFLNFITRGKSNKLFFTSYRSNIFNPLTYIRLFTHSIGHIDLSHLIHNFLFILLIGPMIEEKYGSINLIIMFLITSLVIGLYNTIFSNYSITGASGNVYMLITLSSFSNITDGKIPITLILILIFYILSEFRDRLIEGNKTTYHTGHLLGAVCGIAFGFYFLYFKTFPFIQYMIK
ncbi:MAG: rhomboid family intramembrane serine protease [Bacilli bacterium]|nr:rhomboid family intramembrane serine protease [Bacilli bacterium]